MTMGNQQIADIWVTAMQTGDIGSLTPHQSPDMQVWHSYDGAWISLDESNARVGGSVPALRDVRAVATTEGFVLQASLDGPKGPIHIVQVNVVEGGMVTRCEEYIGNQSAR